MTIDYSSSAAAASARSSSSRRTRARRVSTAQELRRSDLHGNHRVDLTPSSRASRSKRPQDRVPLRPRAGFCDGAARNDGREEGRTAAERPSGRAQPQSNTARRHRRDHGAQHVEPSVMVGAGLVAKKAVEEGPSRRSRGEDEPCSRIESVLTIFGRRPARHVSDNLASTRRYGCTTCIGNTVHCRRRLGGD